jgi:ribulose-5-phosphate 4-epimerase/fuculose-1-phosphate aldolase
MMMEPEGRVAIHAHAGVAAEDNLAGRERLARDLGEQPCMILRRHGLLTVGRSVAEACHGMWHLAQACRIQRAAQSSGAGLAIPRHGRVLRRRAQPGTGPTKGRLPWRALRRKPAREQPDCRA